MRDNQSIRATQKRYMISGPNMMGNLDYNEAKAHSLRKEMSRPMQANQIRSDWNQGTQNVPNRIPLASGFIEEEAPKKVLNNRDHQAERQKLGHAQSSIRQLSLGAPIRDIDSEEVMQIELKNMKTGVTLTRRLNDQPKMLVKHAEGK